MQVKFCVKKTGVIIPLNDDDPNPVNKQTYDRLLAHPEDYELLQDLTKSPTTTDLPPQPIISPAPEKKPIIEDIVTFPEEPHKYEKSSKRKRK